MESNDLGSALHPVKNNIELSRAIIGKEKCTIYTVNTFKISNENLDLLELKKIILVGLAFSQAKYVPNKNKIKRKPLNNFTFDEINKLSFDFKIDINLENNQKGKYLSGGM